MKRTDKNRNLLITAFAVASLSIAPNLVPAAVAGCPDQVQDHIPVSPPSPTLLNIGTVKDLMLEYHQKYYDIGVAAVFDSAQTSHAAYYNQTRTHLALQKDAPLR